MSLVAARITTQACFWLIFSISLRVFPLEEKGFLWFSLNEKLKKIVFYALAIAANMSRWIADSPPVRTASHPRKVNWHLMLIYYCNIVWSWLQDIIAPRRVCFKCNWKLKVNASFGVKSVKQSGDDESEISRTPSTADWKGLSSELKSVLWRAFLAPTRYNKVPKII